VRLFIMSAAFGASNVLNKLLIFLITIKETIFKISSRVLFFFFCATHRFGDFFFEFLKIFNNQKLLIVRNFRGDRIEVDNCF
jgi:hypothetical protein